MRPERHACGLLKGTDAAPGNGLRHVGSAGAIWPPVCRLLMLIARPARRRPEPAGAAKAPSDAVSPTGEARAFI
ncbi:MAG: hypothetical protein AB7U35_07635 [Sphingobium sp.]